MYLSIATTHEPATDLGFLLHKHPARLHEFELKFGTAYVVYPQADVGRCEAALILDVDPVGLVRGRGHGDGLFDQYVNDRPYAASSLLAVALNQVFRSAMTGASADRQDLADSAIPLEAVVTPLPLRGGEGLVRSLFEPLQWAVTVEATATDAPQAAAGTQYARVTLTGTARLSTLLSHLYVLIPVMDDDKHYFVGEDEVEKLLRRGAGWLDRHPARDLITRRYLRHQRSLTRVALERLAPETLEQDGDGDARDASEAALEKPVRLQDERLEAVVAALQAAGARTVADLGCGEGKLLQRLLRERWAVKLFGLDPASRTLEAAAKRLKLHVAGGPPEGRVVLLHGSLNYRDERWSAADAAALVEVIEHLDPDRLPLLEHVVFAAARPRTVVVTTPNVEYNVLFPGLRDGRRHPDHRFEWTRAEFRAWTEGIERQHGYRAAISSIGPEHQSHGAPTQMAVFAR